LGFFLPYLLLVHLGHANAWDLAFSITGIVQLSGLLLFLKIYKHAKIANLQSKMPPDKLTSKAPLNPK